MRLKMWAYNVLGKRYKSAFSNEHYTLYTVCSVHNKRMQHNYIHTENKRDSTLEKP
jgi:hypothetical protein